MSQRGGDGGAGNDSRLDEIVEVLMAYARQDFSPRLEVSERLDDIDAIATGINMLAEELHGEVASRRDLEAALASLKSAQDQLVMAEKLAAIGQLASGVAHELNNPSTWVLLGLELVQRRLSTLRATAATGRVITAADLDDALKTIDESLVDVRAGFERMRSVIADLGMLSRTEASRTAVVDLDDVVRSACQLARPAYHSVARLTLDLRGTPPLVGDRAHLGQIVTNLVVNAAHALSEGPMNRNEIVVSTRVEGSHAVLVVEDNGPGIPEALRERVFEPYFTTKPADVGTGLGLVLTRRIAERHGGSVHVVDGIRGGACIEVRLPLTPSATTDGSRISPMAIARPVSPTAHGPISLPAHAPMSPPADSPTPHAPMSRTAQPPTALTPEPRAAALNRAWQPRVLFIDDEPLLLKSIAEMLDSEVDLVTALGGDAALELLGRDRNFDLVICDLQMPRTDGAAIHAALETTAPELVSRLVIMSGGAVTARARQFLERVRPRLLPKPLAIDDALALIQASMRPRPTE